jgi:hypothetical protein
MPRDAFRNDGESAKELLLADLKYLNDSFWKNEEIGEKRVTFFISLATAVLGFLGALAKTNNPPTDNNPHPEIIYIFALVILLTIGIVTLFRIFKRNKVTEEYKKGMDSIRDIFEKHFDKGKYLVGYDPLSKKKGKPASGGARDKKELRQFGGLAHTVAALNSLIITALAGVILWPCISAVIGGGLIVFIFAFYSQHDFIQRMDKLAKKQVWG